jgi:cell division protein FtsI (penicillin-binding protein 3)
MISNKLKKAKLDSYLRAYGFGSKTGLNFPGEAPGILLDPKDYSDTSIATVPIGNGLAVTPMQMLSVYMTIANDGLRVPPKLIKSFINPDGTRSPFSTAEPKRVISEQTAKTIQSMLRGVVVDGTGKLADVPGYSVSGKTGTARKPPYDKPPYKYMASFAGFAPANDPRLATIVILDEPQAEIYGGRVAAPVFSRIMQSALRVVGVTPDISLDGQAVKNETSVTTTTTTAPAVLTAG